MKATESAEAPRLQRRCSIAADHPAFAGHFPGRPVLPGVILLAEVVEAIRADLEFAAALGGEPLLLSAKFLLPVGPGCELRIDLQLSGVVLEFEVSVAGATVAKGKYQAVAR